jgi:predicted ATP-dependent endonuclease of OLD family
MKHYLTLIIFINYITSINKEKKKIILLDEPDKFLHALAVLDLKKYLNEISNENLIFLIATHNPYFVDEENFHEISFIVKNNKEKGSIIIEKFARKSTEEEESTLQPFITKMGLDIKSFIALSEKKIVFVEGFHDLILFSSACNQLKKNNNDK